MFYDALTLRAYALELAHRFPVPWFVQKLSQIDEHDYLLSCRLGPGQRLRLLISLQPGRPDVRWWRGDKPLARPPSSFTMLCRKHLQGRSFHRLESGYPERTLRLHSSQNVLVLELLERQPNLLLLDALGNVLGGHRLGRQDERDLRPRRPYREPARPELLAADQLSSYQLEELYLADPQGWPQSLSARVFGLSPAAAAQLSSRFDELATSWQELWQGVEPGHYRAERLENGRLTIWGKGPPRALLELEEELAPAATPPGLEQQRQRAMSQLAKAEQKLRSRLGKLEEDRERVAQADRLQREGELLLTYGHSIPRGAQTAELLDWDGETRYTLTLDPARSTTEEAQRRLKRAAKFRRSLPTIAERVELTRAELSRLAEARFQLQNAESAEEIRELLVPQTAGKKILARPRSAGPRRYRFGEYLMYVGRSPKQNDMLVQRLSSRDDLWFHVKDAPGAHVVLKTAGRSPGQEEVEAAATLAAHYSSRSEETKVLVSFTSAQRVKKPGGAAPGFVVYTDELTLWVRPDSLPAGLQRDDN